MTNSQTLLSRRTAIGAALASGGLFLFGCSRAEEISSAPDNAAAPAAAPAASAAATMTVFRDPGCGCCERWGEIARDAGYSVTVRDDQAMRGVKRRLGVPEQLSSCHTAEVAGFVIEGHVPLDDVARLIRERPHGIKGLAVPGMPAGSPGMEMPDGRRDSFEVIAFDASGKTSVFSKVGASA